MSDELERSALAECEAIIERGLQTFYEVGMALQKIRDEELFRKSGYCSFRQYLKGRWLKNDAYAYRLIDAADVVQDLLPMGSNMPESERVARPLVRLEPEERREAWKMAVEQSKTGQPTYRQVNDVVRTQFENRPTVADEAAERRACEAEARECEAQERAEQLYRERQEAEQQRREAERRAEELLRERDEIRLNRYMLYSGLIEAVRKIADFHIESVADAWDGIWGAKGGEDFMENLDKAQRCLSRLKIEHPNAVRKPGKLLQKPS